MTLRIYIDFKNPASYLALGPTCALLDRLGTRARWLPFCNSEETIPARLEVETRGEQHRRVRALARRQTHLLYADVQRLAMNFRDDPGSTDCALAALALLEDEPLPFIRAAFDSYWVRGDDLDDPGIVKALWDASTDDTLLDLEAGRGALEQIREDAIESRVFMAPSFLLGEQLFLGREHLPWIECLLTGGEQA